MTGLFDLHTHMPQRAAGHQSAELRAATIARMDLQGIDHAMVMPLDGLYFDPPRGNDDVYGVCSSSDGRLVAACTVNPRDPDAEAELDRCAEAGFRALKLHPWLQGFSPIEPAVVAVARRAARHGMPLLIHDGTPPFGSPMQIGELAALVPEGTVVLAHGGLMDLWQDAVAAVNRWPNVMVTLCGTAPGAILRQVLDGVPVERVAVGTDTGFGDPDLSLQRLTVLRRLLADLVPADAAAVRHGNATRWLGLS